MQFSTYPQRSSQQEEVLFMFSKRFLWIPVVVVQMSHSCSPGFDPHDFPEFLSNHSFPQAFFPLCPLYLAQKRVQYASGTSATEKS
jgi:hypothetical protein